MSTPKRGLHRAPAARKHPAKRRLPPLKTQAVQEKYDKDRANASKDTWRDTRLRIALTAGGALLPTAVSRLSGMLPTGFVTFVNSAYQSVAAGMKGNPIGQFVLDNAGSVTPLLTASAITGVVSLVAGRRKAKREALEADEAAAKERAALTKEGIDPDEHPLRAVKRLTDELHAYQSQPDTAQERRHNEVIAELRRQHGEIVVGLRGQIRSLHEEHRSDVDDLRQQLVEMQRQHAEDLAAVRDEVVRQTRPSDSPRHPPADLPKMPGFVQRVFRPGAVRDYAEKTAEWGHWRAQQVQPQPARPVPLPPQDTGQAAPDWGVAQGQANYPSAPRGGVPASRDVQQQNPQRPARRTQRPGR